MAANSLRKKFVNCSTGSEFRYFAIGGDCLSDSIPNSGWLTGSYFVLLGISVVLPLPGKIIAGRYKLESEIGRGGMGIVLRAQDTRLNRTVAVKMLLPSAAQSEFFRQRLDAEAHIASALNHPGIATVYDFCEQDEAAFIIYEFVPGHTLRHHLQSRCFSFKETLDAALQLTEALSAAHESGITHRDLKPENIMVTPDSGGGCRMKILDFGLAKQLQEPHDVDPGAPTQTMLAQTEPGFRLGTLAYMAPEQLEGGRADARTDIYSLGLVIYEIATGIHPFRGPTQAATIANALATTAPPPSRHNSTLTADFDRAVQKCLRKNAADRFQSTREMLIDFRHVTQNLNYAPARQKAILLRLAGLLRQVFALMVRHGWEVLHVRLCIWCVLLVYAGWQFSLATPGIVGLVTFFAALICTTVLILLLCFLLYTQATDRNRLGAEMRRMSQGVRLLSIAIGLLAWAMAVMVAIEHTILAVFLTVIGTLIGITVLTFKPAMDRKILSSEDH